MANTPENPRRGRLTEAAAKRWNARRIATQEQIAGPGWYSDPEMAGTQRYWDGTEWTDHVAPSGPARTMWGAVRIVALGVIVAFAAIWFVVERTGPSEAECVAQRGEFVRGLRSADAVHSDCY